MKRNYQGVFHELSTEGINFSFYQLAKLQIGTELLDLLTQA